MSKMKELEEISTLLVNNHETLSVAESVTAGQLQHTFSQASNATCFFDGGVTTYNARQKNKLLQVNLPHALACNSVSAQVAREMAIGCRRLFNSDWAIGITGYATPVPDLGIQQPFAYYAIAHHDLIVQVEKISAGEAPMPQNQDFYSSTVIRFFRELLRNQRGLKV